MNREYFDKCVELARKAFSYDEVPVGAIVVKNGEIIGCGYNKKESSQLSTRHAEIVAIENANKKIGSWRLDGCILYVTLEPCIMCCGAIIESRIDKVVYLVKRTNVQFKSGDYINSILNDENAEIKEEYLNILSTFFENKRK